MASGRLEFAKRLVEIWNSGQYERWLDELGPEFTFTPDPIFPDAGTYRGADLRRWMGEWIATWKQNRFELLRAEEVGDALLLAGRWHLATREGEGDMPLAEFTMVLFYPDRDADRPGRIAAFFDPAQARKAASGTG